MNSNCQHVAGFLPEGQPSAGACAPPSPPPPHTPLPQHRELCQAVLWPCHLQPQQSESSWNMPEPEPMSNPPSRQSEDMFWTHLWASMTQSLSHPKVTPAVGPEARPLWTCRTEHTWFLPLSRLSHTSVSHSCSPSLRAGLRALPARAHTQA